MFIENESFVEIVTIIVSLFTIDSQCKHRELLKKIPQFLCKNNSNIFIANEKAYASLADNDNFQINNK